MRPRRNPYIRIVEAARAGRGVSLSAEECYFMQFDSAIAQVAALTLGGEESDGGAFLVTKEEIRAADDVRDL